MQCLNSKLVSQITKIPVPELQSQAIGSNLGLFKILARVPVKAQTGNWIFIELIMCPMLKL